MVYLGLCSPNYVIELIDGVDLIKRKVALCEDYDANRVAKNSIIEIKEDGVLILAERGVLWSRDGYNVSHRYPDVLPHLPINAVLLLEMCVFDFAQNPRKSKFEGGIQKRYLLDNKSKIRIIQMEYPCTAYIFDCIEYDGKDLRKEPLKVRRQFLEKIGNIRDSHGFPRVIVSEQFQFSQLAKLQDFVSKHKLEGVVVKDSDAMYVADRTYAMMKLKDWKYDEFSILRFENTDNDGFVIYIQTKNQEQRVVINDVALQNKVRSGAKNATVGFLHYTDSGQLRQPHVKGIS